MKYKRYVRISILNHTNEDAYENCLPAIALIVEMIIFALLQGEFNAVSITLLMGTAIMMIKLSYRIGKKVAESKDKLAD